MEPVIRWFVTQSPENIIGQLRRWRGKTEAQIGDQGARSYRDYSGYLSKVNSIIIWGTLLSAEGAEC